jgi:hypothetical protein
VEEIRVADNYVHIPSLRPIKFFSNYRIYFYTTWKSFLELLDNIFIYLMTTIHSMTNFGHSANFSRVNGI